MFFCSLLLFAEQKNPRHFVLVHGAWHGAWCWYNVQEQLIDIGHQATVLDLPGHGIRFEDPLDISLEDYRDAVTDLLDTFREPVILVGHSMGGIVISMAAEARPDKISTLVYLAAFMVRNGQSLLDVAVTDTASLVLPNLIPLPEQGIIDINRTAIIDMFYHLSDPEFYYLAATLLRPDPIIPFDTPLQLTRENYGSVDRIYIYTTEDQAITPFLQHMMTDAQPCLATFSIRSDHSPFFSEPKKLRKILEDIADEKY
jgi:pimeloyl-ACP methyl ester carboxylesterase